jgi:hypothetical protein
MDSFLKSLFLENFPQKLFSLFAAAIIWVLVSNSMTITKTFTRIRVRIVNLPPDTTVRGLTPEGVLERRISVTLTGNKNVLSTLGPNDFEVVLDASNKPNEWVARIVPQNLVSLNPDVELVHAVSSISHNEFIFHLCPLVTARIPIFIVPPKGEAPEGYQFLNVWPQSLYHVLSGPQQDIEALQKDGIELQLDLSKISKEELDLLRGDDPRDEEVSLYVPEALKKIKIPFLNNATQTINSPEARQLRIDFLHKTLIAIDGPLPIRLFYPPTTARTLNAATLTLQPSACIERRDDTMFLIPRVYARDVNRLFIDIVKDRMEVVVIPSYQEGKIYFRWDVQFIDAHQLEEEYVTIALSTEFDEDVNLGSPVAIRQQLAQREHYLRQRFRDYMRKLQLYTAEGTPLKLSFSVHDKAVFLDEVF